MDDDTRDAIADLRDDMDRQAQQYERAASRLRPVSATDSSRSVTVRLDESGAVRSVTVTDAWRTELGSEGLGAGVLEAYGAAGAERVRGWGGAVADASTEPRPVLRSAPGLYTTLAGQLMELGDHSDQPGSEATIAALREMVQDLRRGMHEVFAGVEAQLDAEHTGASSNGHVTVAVSGVGGLVSLTFDERWLESVHAFNVSREITEAIHDGMRKVASTDAASRVAGTSLERVTRLTQDADALAAFVREHRH